ncbi:carbohydrate sulfotransferase 8-like isoform X1 [Pleurodeles waltl]|uniref:carbohydrate sulfotransferase 8-like isoform X1 n=1 Tax=Pleurodeles waltl TaxID=8319 RepID=UPI00370990B4
MNFTPASALGKASRKLGPEKTQLKKTGSEGKTYIRSLFRKSFFTRSSFKFNKLTMMIVRRKWVFIIIPSSALVGFLSVLQTTWYTRNISPRQDWQVIQVHRKNILNSMCTKYNISDSTTFLNRRLASQLYVEHNYQLIYCEVPKTGCSNWKRILFLLQTNVTKEPGELTHEFVHNTSNLQRLVDYPHHRQMAMLQNYTKVMFSRHPFERLASAYKNKFLYKEKSEYYSKIIRGRIKKMFRNSKHSDGVVTFQEFVSFVLKENPLIRDPHWDAVSRLCSPCSIHYDILGKFETVKDDAEHVLRIIGAPEHLHFPDIKQHPNEIETNKRMIKQYFQNLSSESLQPIQDIYSLDFALFHYPIYITNKTFEDTT